ncbi:MAG: hypothetical protein BRC26_00185 [Nanohaloarchaea archaeon QH_8_44_6]|nr:MAG: hypothetical protein BRC26_00185 [Nanohaloarchaea archaeon QH_8_44_6]
MASSKESSTLEDLAAEYLEYEYEGDFIIDAEIDRSERKGEIRIDFEGEEEYPELGIIPEYVINELGLEKPNIFSVLEEKEGKYMATIKGTDKSSLSDRYYALNSTTFPKFSS